jgi:hypothetical protein
MSTLWLMIRWIFDKRNRVEYQEQMVELAATTTDYTSLRVASREEDYRIQLDMMDRRDGMLYARCLYTPASARALADHILQIATVVERMAEQDGRTVHEQSGDA